MTTQSDLLALVERLEPAAWLVTYRNALGVLCTRMEDYDGTEYEPQPGDTRFVALLNANDVSALLASQEAGSGEAVAFVVVGHGGGDAPDVVPCVSWEQVPKAISHVVFGDESEAQRDEVTHYANEADEAFTIEGQWSWSVQFEDGSLTVYRLPKNAPLYTLPAAPAKEAMNTCRSCGWPFTHEQVASIALAAMDADKAYRAAPAPTAEAEAAWVLSDMRRLFAEAQAMPVPAVMAVHVQTWIDRLAARALRGER